MKKIVVSFFCFLLIYGFSACNTPSNNNTKNEQTKSSASGQAVYKAYCLACHGKNGNAKLAGAKDLTASSLSETAVRQIIEQGSENKKMMAYGKILKPSDLEAVTAYVMDLRK